MKRFLFRLVLFMGVAAIGYALLICVWGLITPLVLRPNMPFLKGVYGHMHTRSHEVAEYGKVDILVLGSSRAYRGFDPRVFESHGIRLFNLGSTAQSPVQSLMLARQHLQRLEPKLVLVEVGPEIFSSDGVESGLDVLANNRVDKHSLAMAIQVSHVKIYNTMIYAWFRQFFNLDKNFVEPRVINEDTYIPGGFVQREISHYEPKSRVKSSRRELLKHQKQALEKLVAWLAHQGIDVVLVEAPTTAERFRSYANHDEFTNYLQEIAPFVSFNQTISLNDSLHFYDASHLNQYGVEKFNEAFIARITEEGWLAPAGNLELHHSN